MDTLEFLRSKAERLSVLMPKSGILAVLRHIEIGEQHFQRGREEGNSDLFSDVIYRTNQAFEGSLRESYSILAGQDPGNKRAFELESYFADNKIFQDRVTDLFTNYRRKWRNPSTHDHLATFTESEAFLSLLSVTSFAGVLIDQMIERLTFEYEKNRLAEKSDILKKELGKHASEPFVDRLTVALQNFVSQPTLSNVQSEVELAANLNAFLDSILPSIKSSQEPLLHDSQGKMRPDFIITEGDSNAVIELKHFRTWNDKMVQASNDQIRRYMNAVNAEVGVVLLVPSQIAKEGEEIKGFSLATPLDDGRYVVIIRGARKIA
jgi:hypothetical protein